MFGYLDFAQSVSDVLGLCRLEGDGQHALGPVQPAQQRAHVLLEGGGRRARLGGPVGGRGGEKQHGKTVTHFGTSETVPLIKSRFISSRDGNEEEACSKLRIIFVNSASQTLVCSFLP